MAKPSASTQFRKVDIDQYDADQFQDEGANDDTANQAAQSLLAQLEQEVRIFSLISCALSIYVYHNLSL